MSAAILDPKTADDLMKEKIERESKKINFRRILLVVKKGEVLKTYSNKEAR
jgi:hypothetical protein